MVSSTRTRHPTNASEGLPISPDRQLRISAKPPCALGSAQGSEAVQRQPSVLPWSWVDNNIDQVDDAPGDPLSSATPHVQACKINSPQQGRHIDYAAFPWAIDVVPILLSGRAVSHSQPFPDIENRVRNAFQVSILHDGPGNDPGTVAGVHCHNATGRGRPN